MEREGGERGRRERWREKKREREEGEERSRLLQEPCFPGAGDSS